MRFEITLADGLYSVRDSRTGRLILEPSPPNAAIERLYALGHTAAADRIRDDARERAETGASPYEPSYALPDDVVIMGTTEVLYDTGMDLRKPEETQ